MPQRKIPRGAGYDQRSIARHLKALEAFDGSPVQYARRAKLAADAFVGACEKHFPERWQEMYGNTLEESTCPYCEETFVANRAGQEYCSRLCGEHARADEQYFGGKRREAVGMVEGVCQLCWQSPKKGLSPHHLIGAENDPENQWLCALCLGCHRLVTDASRRLFLREPEGWERLRRLVEVRAAGVIDDKPFWW